jgi:hypothetical protein
MSAAPTLEDMWRSTPAPRFEPEGAFFRCIVDRAEFR